MKVYVKPSRSIDKIKMSILIESLKESGISNEKISEMISDLLKKLNKSKLKKVELKPASPLTAESIMNDVDKFFFIYTHPEVQKIEDLSEYEQDIETIVIDFLSGGTYLVNRIIDHMLKEDKEGKYRDE